MRVPPVAPSLPGPLPRLLALLGAAALLGCGDSQSPSTVSTCPDNVVTVAVENPASAAPGFTWTPACAVTLLQVSALEPSSGLVWSIGGHMQNILPSGIVYGHVPLGGEEEVPSAPLQTGVTYEVRVMRAVQTSDGVGLGGGGVATFTH